MSASKRMEEYLANLFAQAESHPEPLVGKLSKALARCYELLKEEQAEAAKLRGSQKLLLTLEGDGMVYVYGEPGLHVKVAHLPVMDDRQCFHLAYEMIVSQWPQIYQEMYLQTKPVASGNLKCCPTRSSLKLAQLEQNMLCVLNVLDEERKNLANPPDRGDVPKTPEE